MDSELESQRRKESNMEYVTYGNIWHGNSNHMTPCQNGICYITSLAKTEVI